MLLDLAGCAAVRRASVCKVHNAGYRLHEQPLWHDRGAMSAAAGPLAQGVAVGGGAGAGGGGPAAPAAGGGAQPQRLRAVVEHAFRGAVWLYRVD